MRAANLDRLRMPRLECIQRTCNCIVRLIFETPALLACLSVPDSEHLVLLKRARQNTFIFLRGESRNDCLVNLPSRDDQPSSRMRSQLIDATFHDSCHCKLSFFS